MSLGTLASVAKALKCAALACNIAVQAVPQIPESAKDTWLSLLHYQPRDASWVSEVEDQGFFLDSLGRRDPVREWNADYRAFLLPANDEVSERHAQCRFPARFALMKKALHWSDRDVQPVICLGVAAHQRRLNAKTLSVVFVTGYLRNPASAFGHAMLYIGSDSKRSEELGDFSVSFEAETEGMSPAKYLPRGLFGGLLAGFRLDPLYVRVRKYEREEQRDLWIFPLQLTQEELDMLVLHLWELKDVTFRYGFFEGNCAQKLLDLVQGVAPHYRILPYGGVAILPSEAARHLVQQVGSKGKPLHRPSLRSQYSRQISRLDPLQKEQLAQMIASRSVAAGASSSVLAAALVWSELETPYRAFRRATDSEDVVDLVWRRALWNSLVARGDTISNRSDTLLDETDLSLLRAHGPSLFGLRGGYQKSGGTRLDIATRWLLHDVIDPQAGYPNLSTLEVARLDVSLSASGRVLLNEATAIRVESFASASGLQSPLAWKMEIGGRRLAHDNESIFHTGIEMQVGLGAARVRSVYSLAGYAMVGTRTGTSSAHGRISFLPLGVSSAGLIVKLPHDLRAHLSSESTFSLSKPKGATTTVSLLMRKGLAKDLDLDFASRFEANTFGASFGFASYH